MSGGFRVRFGDWRFALTSPYRLLIWGFAIGLVRHAIAPRPAIYRDLPRRLTLASRTPSARAAATAFAGTRPAILFVGYLAVFAFGYPGRGAPWKIVENEFVNLQARWDTGWYSGWPSTDTATTRSIRPISRTSCSFRRFRC